MTDHDINWLNSQQPQQLGGDDDARDRARLALIRHIEPQAARRARRLRPRIVGFTAAVGLAAVAAAVVLSAGASGGGASGGGALGADGGAASQAMVHHAATGTGSALVRLADYVSTSGTPAGDATLVARTTATGGNSVTVYDLYGDNGQYFFSAQRSGLQAQVSAGHNLADGLFAREIAAAKEAVTGNVQTAAQDMADAADPDQVVPRNPAVDQAAIGAKLQAAGVKKMGKGAHVPGNRFDNYAWENSLDALVAGAGDPQVRGGVLQILATVPGVTVTQATSGGEPTLVLTAGANEVGSGYSEQLTINAQTGVPVQFVGGPSGGTPSTTVDYEVSRVTLADPSADAGSAA